MAGAANAAEMTTACFDVVDRTVDSILLRGLDPSVTIEQAWETVWITFARVSRPHPIGFGPVEAEELRQKAHARFLSRMRVNRINGGRDAKALLS